MKFSVWPYLIVIVAAGAGFLTLNLTVLRFVYDFPVWVCWAGVIGGIIAAIAIDGICAAACHKFWLNRVNPNSKYFTVSKRERAFLTAIGIKRLKDYVPDLGALVNFKKRKIEKINDPEYIHRYIIESCAGELGHVYGATFGVLVALLFPLQIGYFLCFGLPIIVVNGYLCILAGLVLRYNRYMLNLLHLRQTRKTAD